MISENVFHLTPSFPFEHFSRFEHIYVEGKARERNVAIHHIWNNKFASIVTRKLFCFIDDFALSHSNRMGSNMQSKTSPEYHQADS